ncbi:MAG TPA: hypothetical protein VKB53_04740 [Gammaproteobacteria bacterium]|nr:hypothetical protein [Gammaproteobacteria bacterium]
MIWTVMLVGFLVTAAVLIHYEMLYRLATLMPGKADKHRYHVLVGILGSLCACHRAMVVCVSKGSGRASFALPGFTLIWTI